MIRRQWLLLLISLSWWWCWRHRGFAICRPFRPFSETDGCTKSVEIRCGTKGRDWPARIRCSRDEGVFVVTASAGPRGNEHRRAGGAGCLKAAGGIDRSYNAICLCPAVRGRRRRQRESARASAGSWRSATLLSRLAAHSRQEQLFLKSVVECEDRTNARIVSVQAPMRDIVGLERSDRGGEPRSPHAGSLSIEAGIGAAALADRIQEIRANITTPSCKAPRNGTPLRVPRRPRPRDTPSPLVQARKGRLA